MKRGLARYREWDPVGADALEELLGSLSARRLKPADWAELDKLYAVARGRKTARAYGRGIGRVMLALLDAAKKGA